jgi:hypothetical protein
MIRDSKSTLIVLLAIDEPEPAVESGVPTVNYMKHFVA